MAIQARYKLIDAFTQLPERQPPAKSSLTVVIGGKGGLRASGRGGEGNGNLTL